MEIEILKKSVERFWQTVDFGSALPDGVKIQTCVATGDGAGAVLGDGELAIVEKGRAVRMMIEKGQPDGDHALTLVLTLSDGQVVAQDVVVRASDEVRKAGGDVEGGTWITTENGRKLFIADGETAGQALGRATGGAVGAKPGSEKLTAKVSAWKDKANKIASTIKGTSTDSAKQLFAAGRHMDAASEHMAVGKYAAADSALKDAESALQGAGGALSDDDAGHGPDIDAITSHVSSMRNDIRASLSGSRTKKSARTYSGNFAQPTNAAHADAYAVRAYGSGPDDKRVFRAKTAGLPVATCPDCDMDSEGERREVTVKELALSRNALSRGKMSRMASALRDGVREGDDFAAIKVAELHDGEGEGPRYAVLPGQGNHRIAHLMLSRKSGTVPVMVVPRKGVAKYDPDQPRDEDGKFGDGGGSSVKLTKPSRGGWESRAHITDSVQQTSIQDLGANWGLVIGTPDLSTVATKDLDRALGFGSRVIESMQRNAREGKTTNPIVMGAIKSDVSRIMAEIVRREEPRGVRKQLSTETPGKGAEFVPLDMAERRARVRERVARKRKKTLTR